MGQSIAGETEKESVWTYSGHSSCTRGSEADLMEDQFMSFFSREIQRQAAKSTCLEAQTAPSD